MARRRGSAAKLRVELEHRGGGAVAVHPHGEPAVRNVNGRLGGGGGGVIVFSFSPGVRGAHVKDLPRRQRLGQAVNVPRCSRHELNPFERKQTL